MRCIEGVVYLGISMVDVMSFVFGTEDSLGTGSLIVICNLFSIPFIDMRFGLGVLSLGTIVPRFPSSPESLKATRYLKESLMSVWQCDYP